MFGYLKIQQLKNTKVQVSKDSKSQVSKDAMLSDIRLKDSNI